MEPPTFLETRLSRMRDDACVSRAGAYSSDSWDIDTPWHHHDMHQLIYAFEDSLEVEGKAGRYKIPSQFAGWISAGTVHRTKLQKVRSGSVFLNADMVACAPGAVRVIPVTPLMREMIMHAMRWPLNDPLGDAGEKYFDCFAALAGEWIETEVKILLPASDDKQVAAAMDYTKRGIADITLAEVCRKSGMSERSLRRKFRAEIGMSWEEFRQRQRMVLAIESLDATQKPIGQIAAEIGYDNQAAFAKAFRAVMGVAPNEYRKARA